MDGRSDLYSLGVMLFQLLTGVLPLKGDSMAALMYQIATSPRRACAACVPNSASPGRGAGPHPGQVAR